MRKIKVLRVGDFPNDIRRDMNLKQLMLQIRGENEIDLKIDRLSEIPGPNDKPGIESLLRRIETGYDAIEFASIPSQVLMAELCTNAPGHLILVGNYGKNNAFTGYSKVTGMSINFETIGSQHPELSEL